MDARTLVSETTCPTAVPCLPEIRLYLADDFLALWHAQVDASPSDEISLPFWGAAWAGGIGIARYLRDHAEIVAGSSVLDAGCGSGLCGIAACMSGAAHVSFVDTDPVACEATRMNLELNRLHGAIRCVDATQLSVGESVVLAGDLFYERRMVDRMLPWLRSVAAAGVLVLAGDPGRGYRPRDGVEILETYVFSGMGQLEDSDTKTVAVCRIQPLKSHEE